MISCLESSEGSEMLLVVAIIAALAIMWTVAAGCTAHVSKWPSARQSYFWLGLAVITGAAVVHALVAASGLDNLTMTPVVMALIGGMTFATYHVRRRTGEVDLEFAIWLLIAYGLAATAVLALDFALLLKQVTWAIAIVAVCFATWVVRRLLPDPPDNPVIIEKPAFRAKR